MICSRKDIIWSFVSTPTTHIANQENLYVHFSSLIFPGCKLSKSNKNIKISKHCKSGCTSLFCFKWKIDVNWIFSLPTEKVVTSLPNLTIFSSPMLTANFQKPLLRSKWSIWVPKRFVYHRKMMKNFIFSWQWNYNCLESYICSI